MNDIRTLLKAAARRMEVSSFVSALHGIAIILAALAVVLAVADRVPGAPFVAWTWVAPALAVVGLAIALGRWARRRMSELQVAVAVDERLDLKERLSTALHCDGRADAFAQAAVEDAVTTARDPRSREAVRRRFAVSAPRRWWISPLLVLACGGILLAPQADLFATEQRTSVEEVNRVRVEVQETLEVIVDSAADKPQLSEELDGLVDELMRQTRGADSMKQPDAIKRDALKKVTELNKRLDDILNGEKGSTAKTVEEMMSKLDTPDGGPAKEFADAMASGDFAKAQQALQELMEAAESGSMSPEDQQAMSEQMQALADQLGQLAQQQQALQQALQQAGLNPQLANNPQALQQALQQAQNLNQQQIQQIQQMQQAQQMAQQMCQGMSKACQQMAQGMQMGQQGGQQMQQGGQQMQQQLSQLEQMQQLLQQAQAMANEVQSQGQGLGQGMTMNQALQQWMQGQGMGNRGQGRGGKAPIARTPSGMKIVKDDVPIVDGEIIASMLIDGTPVRGESKAKLQKVVVRAAEGYDEAIAEDPLPRRYHEAQQSYFGELRKQVEAVTAEDAPAPAPPTQAGDGASENDGGE